MCTTSKARLYTGADGFLFIIIKPSGFRERRCVEVRSRIERGMLEGKEASDTENVERLEWHPMSTIRREEPYVPLRIAENISRAAWLWRSVRSLLREGKGHWSSACEALSILEEHKGQQCPGMCCWEERRQPPLKWIAIRRSLYLVRLLDIKRWEYFGQTY